MAAPDNNSMFFKERAAASERSMNDCSRKENVHLLPNIFFYVEDCVPASRNISMFFNERAAASEKVFNDCF